MAGGKENDKSETSKIPAWFQNGFHRFLTPYLRRHFQAVGVERESLARLTKIARTDSVIVYANHPSWWDPLIAHYLNLSFFPDRQFWAPIDADALEQYQVFKKLGFFGVQADSKSGAATFLKTSGRILSESDADGNKTSSLWMTPEGRFSDVRDHTAELMPGLAHLCHKSASGFALPLAMEYVFWDERLPVCLIELGHPIAMNRTDLPDKSAWAETLNSGLRGAQDNLAERAMDRLSEPFENLLVGRSGAGGMYDLLRRAKAKITGQPFKASHGDQF